MIYAVICLAGALLAALLFLVRTRGQFRELDARAVVAKKEALQERQRAELVVLEIQESVEMQRAGIGAEIERHRLHYESEARKIKQEAHEAFGVMSRKLDSLSAYKELLDEEGSAARMLAEAVEESRKLRQSANSLLEAAQTAAALEPKRASERAKEISAKADALLDRATVDTGRLIEEAHEKAEAIARDAYLALREKDQLELAVRAIRNLIDGYGDRYVVPTRSLLDDLASDYGHTEAGARLADARAQTRRMVEEGQAADCDYAEANRRETAIRFVVDAFNGRVDAVLSRVKHDNHGTLSQEIRDVFAVVNLNGTAFRNARIQPAYLEARLNELKWSVLTQELRLREREEQLRIKEQMREEERARREYERAIEESRKEEVAIQKALSKARVEAERASAEQRAELEGQIAELNVRLREAEEKNQRAISMAQQTRKGTIYIISNVGSFGEQVFKIGMTRRMEPAERIKELSDASVPFEFDVHAMITTEDAPALEAMLHREFGDMRINKVNMRKEFFRLPMERLRQILAESGLEVAFTMLAEAREYRETQALERMTPEERTRYMRSQ